MRDMMGKLWQRFLALSLAWQLCVVVSLLLAIHWLSLLLADPGTLMALVRGALTILSLVTVAIVLLDRHNHGHFLRAPPASQSDTAERSQYMLELAAKLKALSSENYMLKATLESLEVGVGVAEGDGTIIYNTRRFETNNGYARGELLGASMDLFAPEHLRVWHKEQREAFFKSDQRQLEIRRVESAMKNGELTETLLGINKTPPIDGRRLQVATTRAPDEQR